MLLIEAACCLGFGARVVTGYLYNPPSTVAIPPSPALGRPMHGRTSTFRGPAGSPTIRQTVTRDISQAVPVAGSFVGAPSDYLGMMVEVAVTSARRVETSSA
jgi:hypothetical protein